MTHERIAKNANSQHNSLKYVSTIESWEIFKDFIWEYQQIS